MVEQHRDSRRSYKKRGMVDAIRMYDLPVWLTPADGPKLPVCKPCQSSAEPNMLVVEHKGGPLYDNSHSCWRCTIAEARLGGEETGTPTF
jgi:hypothetical protein